MALQSEESCSNCMFYMANMKVCRRYPPTSMIVGVKQGLASVQPEPVIGSYFAFMAPNGWCGEWQQEPADLEKTN